MRGLILLDGPDCAGKSTLAKSIQTASAELGQRAVIHHLGKPEDGQEWKLHSTAIEDYIQQMLDENVIVIVDRHFLSEEIYGKVYRNGGAYPYTMRFIDMLYNRFSGLKVICCPPTSVVVDTHKRMMEERYEEYTDKMDRIANLYQGLWHSAVHVSSFPGRDYTGQLTALGGVQDKKFWYHFNYCESDVDEYARYLLQELATEVAIADPFLDSLKFIGTPDRRATLLVGDMSATKNKLGLPFWANHGSSHFLAKTLHQLMVPAESLCIANINDEGGVRTVKQLAEQCGRVVVLGREAQRTMQRENIDYDAYCRHPQHARRFNQNDNTYLDELKKALGA